MDTNHLTSFIEICNQKSYSRAANILHISQPALSQQMKRLENDIGFSLFDHTIKSRIALTEAGKLFLEYAQNTIREYEDIIYKCTYVSNDLKVILIGADFRDFDMFDKTFFEQYKKENPSIDIKIKFVNWANLLEMLYRNELDVVFTSEPLVTEKHYKFIEVEKEYLAVAGNKNHPIFKKDKITLEDFHNLRISLPVNDIGKHVKKINDYLKKNYTDIQYEKSYTDVNYIDIQNTDILYLTVESGKEYFINLECKPLETDLYIPVGFLYRDVYEQEVKDLAKLYKNKRVNL